MGIADKAQSAFMDFHVALAWVYVRNDDFAQSVQRYGLWPLDSALADFNSVTGLDLTPEIESDHQAWELLRAVIVEHNIPVEGFPYAKLYLIPGQSWNCVTTFRQRVSEIGAFQLDTSGNIPSIINESSTSPRRFDRVVVDSTVLDFFLKLEGTPKNRSRAEELIAAAVKDCWPRGDWRQLSRKQRHLRICDWARKNHPEWRDQITDAVSYATVRRYFEPLEKRMSKFEPF